MGGRIGVDGARAQESGQTQIPPGARWLSFGLDLAPDSGPEEPGLALLEVGPQQIQLQASLPGCLAEDLQVDGQFFTRLFGNGYGVPAEVGMPSLPVLRREVEIPFGASVSLELVTARYADFTLEDLGIHPVYPVQPPALKLPGADRDQPLSIRRSFYAESSRLDLESGADLPQPVEGNLLYPKTPVVLGPEAIVRGHRLQTVEVWPAAYSPAKGTLRIYREMVFRLRLSGSDLDRTQARARRYASSVFNAPFEARVLNYGLGTAPQAPETGQAESYLIVSADAFLQAMQPFVQLKESRGFDVTLTALSQIPGGTTPQSIRAYIQNAYEKWPTPPSYLLLVGDTDTLPAWRGTGSPGIASFAVTDLYYAAVDGADWVPDIGVGRFPVRSAVQATAMVDKYLAYANLSGSEAWLKQAAFPATCDGNWWSVAENTHNYTIDGYTAPLGFTGFFPSNPQPGGDKLYCVSYRASGIHLRQAINQGRWAVVYSGHGSYQGWEQLSDGDVRGLSNTGMFPLVVSHACLTGNFEEPQVFGETWVLQEGKGALAFWGASDSTTWHEDDTLQRAWSDALFSVPATATDIAAVTYQGLRAVELSHPNSARYYWEVYNLLGDPSVGLSLEPEAPSFSLGLETDPLEVCSTGEVETSVNVYSNRGYSSTVHLDARPLPDGISAGFDPQAGLAPFQSILDLGVGPGAAPGDYTIAVVGTDDLDQIRERRLSLQVLEDAPAAPVDLLPSDGDMSQPALPVFGWQNAAQADRYTMQLGLSPLFLAPLAEISDILGLSYSWQTPLAEGRCYWWRVRGENACGAGNWTDAQRFYIPPRQAVFTDDMELGAGKWFHHAAQGEDRWQLSGASSHSPGFSWYVPDGADPAAKIGLDSSLRTAAPLAVGDSGRLTFWHRFNFENPNYDGAVLEISPDGGQTWEDLGSSMVENGYNGSISACCSNPLGGRSGWIGDLASWTQVTVDLSRFSGQSVSLRWRMGSDTSIPDAGWFIDDIQITSVPPLEAGPSITEVLPRVGSPLADNQVRILGSNFSGEVAVRLGEDRWLSSVRVEPGVIEAVIPAGLADGEYSLTVYNGDCQAGSLAGAYTVSSEVGPVPVVNLRIHSPVRVGEPVQLSVDSGCSLPVTYRWNFGGPGNGSGLETATPEFRYSRPGEFQVSVTVASTAGSVEVSGTVRVDTSPLFLPLLKP
jgi:hypothetical protein